MGWRGCRCRGGARPGHRWQEGLARRPQKDADGFNLLGYSYRHLKRYDESLAAYEKALAINPKHRGAHEYIGEAYIEMGQLDKARQHLAALDKLCTFSCEEYRELKEALHDAEQAAKSAPSPGAGASAQP